MKSKTTKAVKEPVVTEQVTETINPDAGYTLLIEKGVASKLSPKSAGAVFFQLAVKDEDNSLHLRISGNEGGGLHSKEWVSVTTIIELLKPLKEQSFKSNVFKKVMVGKSSNSFPALQPPKVFQGLSPFGLPTHRPIDCEGREGLCGQPEHCLRLRGQYGKQCHPHDDWCCQRKPHRRHP